MSHYFFLKEAIDVLMLAELKHVMRVFEIMLHPKIIIVIMSLLIKMSIMYFFSSIQLIDQVLFYSVFVPINSNIRTTDS